MIEFSLNKADKQEFDQYILALLLLSVGLITFPHISHIPSPIFFAFNGLLIWRFIGIKHKAILPNKYILFILSILAMGLLYQQHQGVLGRDAGTSLFVIALGLKLMEIRKESDLYLINYLAFIVATSQFIYQQNILMAVYILVVCCILLATLVSINSENYKTVKVIKPSIIIVFQALPLSLIIFVLFPRMEAPGWMMFGQQHSALTGLSDSLEPGSISKLGLSDELVFRAKFFGEIPPANMRYWRGPVYSYTDGKRWTEVKPLTKKNLIDKEQFLGKQYKYTLLMEAQKKNWVFALDLPSSFPPILKKNALNQLINPKNKHQKAEYKLVSHTQYNTGEITKIQRKQNLQLPVEASNRIKTLVIKLGGYKQPAEVYIRTLLLHYKTEKFHYTLRPPLMGDKPIEAFLFDKRFGFCSHYATSFVYLMRVAGIPARVIGGYQGGTINQFGEFLEIKQANAHAWAEVWIKNKGWVRVDPTAAVAPERIEQDVDIDRQLSTGMVTFSPIFRGAGKALSWVKQAQQLWEHVDYNWQHWVINYNGDNQNKFLSLWGINDIWAGIYYLIGTISLLTVFLAWLILRNKKTKVDEELALYQTFCKKMAKVGFNKIPSETADSFSLRIQQSRPDLAKIVIKITQIYTRIRYEKSPSQTDLTLLRKELSTFKVSMNKD